MVEFLLLALLFSLWVLLHPRRDWYVVEWRTCDDKSLDSVAFSSPDFGFGSLALSTYGLSIVMRTDCGLNLLHKGGGMIGIDQVVFADLDAAILHFEQRKPLHGPSGGSSKVFLWRNVARSRKKAFILPPNRYPARDFHLLMESTPLRSLPKPGDDEGASR